LTQHVWPYFQSCFPKTSSKRVSSSRLSIQLTDFQKTCAYATLRQSVANLMFCNVSFNFATAISKFDTFTSYHIVRTRIVKVTNFIPFCTIGISMYQKRILPYIISLFSQPKLLPLWSVTDRQTDRQRNFNTPHYGTLGCDFFRK